MKNKVIQDRLKCLREKMKQKGIDYYLIPTADFHNSEYVCDYFTVREFFSNFSGSNGTLVIWQEGAGLWTDGRYFIQAEEELQGTTVELYRMLDEGVLTIEQFLKHNMQTGQVLGFDGRVISASLGEKYQTELKEKQISLVYSYDLAEEIWKDRPPLPAEKITCLPEELTGKSAREKAGQVREELQKTGAQALLMNKLDDIMWMLNIRGSDVKCNPVALSYCYLTMSEVYIFLQPQAVTREVEELLTSQGVRILEYHNINQFLSELPEGQTILLDNRYISYTLYKNLEKQKTINGKNPTELLKATKNPIELTHMAQVYLQDSVALTRFIYWLKQNIGKTRITELSAAERLENFRKEISGYQGPSFDTIAGYKANAAKMHYSATPKSHSVLEAEGMLLVDSGGQYQGGTTDVTRTIVLGPITDEIKKHYTLVTAGMLELTDAKWLHGCTGRNLDIKAREPVWKNGLDYKCGTGHGIGYMLNVHEGPQSLRWRIAEDAVDAVLEEGMAISNEPGIYIERSHGIRIENIMVVKKAEKNEYGQFMHFDTLTYVPLDREAINEHFLTETQRTLLDDYHKKVYEKISPYLSQEEREWLKEVTEQL